MARARPFLSSFGKLTVPSNGVGSFVDPTAQCGPLAKDRLVGDFDGPLAVPCSVDGQKPGPQERMSVAAVGGES